MSRGPRTLVIGVGDRAKQVLREVRHAEGCALYPVGLIDLNGAGQGRTIGGVRVVGTADDLPAISQKLRAELAIIALDPAELSQMRRVVDQCIAAGLEFKTLPSLHELLESTAGLNQLRNVRLEDLLGRPPVKLD